MKWEIVVSVGVATLLIVAYQWPKWNGKPRRDRVAFAVLLLISCTLALFDLPNVTGPSTLIGAIFKPMTSWMQ